jgi:hypothetical protein
MILNTDRLDSIASHTASTSDPEDSRREPR